MRQPIRESRIGTEAMKSTLDSMPQNSQSVRDDGRFGYAKATTPNTNMLL